tara:strand:+ start:1277 stop:1795 length:519 start_codon:yes stop_codon:yes gene_type:complete
MRTLKTPMETINRIGNTARLKEIYNFANHCKGGDPCEDIRDYMDNLLSLYQKQIPKHQYRGIEGILKLTEPFRGNVDGIEFVGHEDELENLLSNWDGYCFALNYRKCRVGVASIYRNSDQDNDDPTVQDVVKLLIASEEQIEPEYSGYYTVSFRKIEADYLKKPHVEFEIHD